MNEDYILLDKELEKSPLKTFALCFWTSLVETYAEKGFTEKYLEEKLPGFYSLSLSYSEEEAFNRLQKISKYEILFFLDSLSDNQSKLLGLILQFKKEQANMSIISPN